MLFLLTRKTVVSHFFLVVADKVGMNKTLVKKQHRDGMGSTECCFERSTMGLVPNLLKNLTRGKFRQMSLCGMY